MRIFALSIVLKKPILDLTSKIKFIRISITRNYHNHYPYVPTSHILFAVSSQARSFPEDIKI